MPAVTRLISALLFAGGSLVIATTTVAAASGARQTGVVRVLDLLSVGAAVVLWAFAGRVHRVWQHLAMSGALVLITLAVLVSGGGSTAMAYACVYYLVPVYAFFILSGRAAVRHLCAAIGLGAPALAVQPGVGVGEQVILWGVAVLLSAVVGWLVRAVDVAETDSLSGLVNRRGVERALQQAISDARHGGAVAFALLDLDHFKALNDDRGHAAGDQLISQVSLAWARLVPAGATLGRYGGDEFALVLPGWTAAEAAGLADRLRQALPGGGTASAGVAGWEAEESASMLVARTDSAVYAAKHRGRDRTHQHLGVGTGGREVLDGLGREEFVVHFQPIVDLRAQQLVGAEALVRWRHATRGAIAPQDFLPEAERSGAIVELGRWILQEACGRAASWPAADDGVLPYLSVNASGRELQDPGYAATVEDALVASGLDPRRLIIELVESDYDIESLHLVANLHQLKVLGVRTAIDDFGVGHSSLDRLRRLGVDILKIDRSFVADIETASQQAPLVSAILALARAFGLKVIAEGVETPAQHAWLVRNGCDHGQGYLYGRAEARPPHADLGVTTPAPRAQ